MNFLKFCLLKQTRGLFYSSNNNNCVLQTDGVILRENCVLIQKNNFDLKGFCIFTSSKSVFLKIEKFFEQYYIHKNETVLKCKRHESPIEKCVDTIATAFTKSKRIKGMSFFVLKITVMVSTATFCKSVEILFTAQDKQEMFNIFENMLLSITILTGRFSDNFERGNSESSITHHSGHHFDIYLNLSKCHLVNNFAVFHKRSIMFLEDFYTKFELLIYSQNITSLTLKLFTHSFLPVGSNFYRYMILFSFDLNNVRPIIFEMSEFSIKEIMVSSYAIVNYQVVEMTKRNIVRPEKFVKEALENELPAQQYEATKETELVTVTDNNIDFENKKTNRTILTLFLFFLSISNVLFVIWFIYWLRYKKIGD